MGRPRLHECDCGQPRRRYTDCCERCWYLDGGRAFDIIQELREREVCTVYELEFETGRSRRSLLRSLASLMRNGRVRKRTHDAGDTEPRMVSLYALVDRQGAA